jgi:hypothetical protein
MATCGRRAAPFRSAGARLQQSAEDRQQRALAATGRTDNRHHLARAHGERYIVKHLERAEAMADMVGDQVHCFPRSARRHVVIASEAKQSMVSQMEAWIASSLRSSQ